MENPAEKLSHKMVTPALLQTMSSVCWSQWDNFDEIFATGKSDIYCKIKEVLLVIGLKPSLNENLDSERLEIL